MPVYTAQPGTLEILAAQSSTLNATTTKAATKLPSMTQLAAGNFRYYCVQHELDFQYITGKQAAAFAIVWLGKVALARRKCGETPETPVERFRANSIFDDNVMRLVFQFAATNENAVNKLLKRK